MVRGLRRGELGLDVDVQQWIGGIVDVPHELAEGHRLAADHVVPGLLHRPGDPWHVRRHAPVDLA
jgi:hypothetical protein